MRRAMGSAIIQTDMALRLASPGIKGPINHERHEKLKREREREREREWIQIQRGRYYSNALGCFPGFS